MVVEGGTTGPTVERCPCSVFYRLHGGTGRGRESNGLDSSRGQGDQAQSVDDQQAEAGKLSLEVEQTSFVPGLHQLVDQGGCCGEAHRHPFLAGGEAQSQGDVGLAGAAVADGDDILPALYVFAAGQLHHQHLVHRRDGRKVKGVQAFDGGEAGRPDPPLHHALVAIDEFQFRQPEQVPRVVHSLGGALGGHLPILPEEAGQHQFLQMVFQQQRGPVVHAALPDSNVM